MFAVLGRGRHAATMPRQWYDDTAMRCWAVYFAVWVLALADPMLAHARRRGLDRYERPLVAAKGPLVLARKSYLVDADPGAEPLPWAATTSLDVAASPGEHEPAAFVVYATSRIRRVNVQVSALQGPQVLDASNIKLRAVTRARTRINFNLKPTTNVGRFLPTYAPRGLERGEFREFWLDLHIPSGTQPGVYRGSIVITADKVSYSRPLRVRVRNLQLREPTDKHVGMYYRMVRRQLDRQQDVIARELADMRAHGVDNLVLDLRPMYGLDKNAALLIDTRLLAQGLDLVAAAGFTGAVVVDSGLVPLAQLLGHSDVAYAGQQGDSLVAGPRARRFANAAREALEAIVEVGDRHQNLQIAVAHLDEIFGQGRLELFERLAQVSRSVPQLPIYAPFSTLVPEHDQMLERVDPFVDIRCNHGYSFEWWLARGQGFADYEAQLARSGDRAWFYHNERGTHFTPGWARLVNGLYLWASPFEAHAIWAYQRFDHDPYDDTDGQWHDFGMTFPDLRDPEVLVPTRAWQAVREGYDDLRYLATLTWAIRTRRHIAPEEAERAAVFLATLREDLRRAPAGVRPRLWSKRLGTAAEAPYLDAVSQRYDAGHLALVRERAEEFTVALLTATSSPI